MTKNLTALVLAAALMVTLAACGNSTTPSTSSAPESSSSLTVQEKANREIEPVAVDMTTESLLAIQESEALTIKEQLKPNYETYRARNNDVSGIFRVVGLGIDQPVVSVSHNLEYLRTNVDKEDAFTGVLFFDERIQGSVKTVPNVVIYGHNVGNGSTDMFAPLLKMEDQEVFDKVSMMLYQDDTLFVYKPIAAYVTDISNPYNDPYPAKLADVLADRTESPTADLEVTEDSKLLTLSTCTNVTSDERFTVQAVLVAEY